MTKYRKKPVVVEVEQFVVWDLNKVPLFITIHGVTFPVTRDCTILIPTLEGQRVVSNLDYVIKGVKGEFYSCKPDIFEMTHEPVKQQDDVNW